MTIYSKSFTLLLFLIFINSHLLSQCNTVNVNLGADTSICFGSSIILYPTITGSPSNVIYSWSFGGVLITNANNSSYTIPINQSGIYSVNVSYGSNCSKTDQIEISYLNPGVISSDQIICSNGDPSLIQSTTDAFINSAVNIRYQWQYSIDNINWNNITGAISENFDPSNISQDTYYRRVASLNSSNNPICSSYSNVVFIDVISGLTLNAGNDINTCSGQTVSFAPSINGAGSYSVNYQWTGPSNFNSTNNSPTISNIKNNNSGTYTLSATIGNCIVQDQVNISVVGFSITSQFFNSNNTQLVACLSSQETSGDIGFNFVLPTNSATIQSININWGDGNTDLVSSSSYSNLQLHNYLPGSYQLTITLTSTSGCTHIVNYPLFVGSSPSPAALQLFINQANGCVPHSTNYTFSVPSSNVNGTTYIVTWGDGTPNEIYTHPNAPSILSHVYSISSCGNSVSISNTTYNNVFQPSVITQNPCSVQPQPAAAGLISVGLPPDASFTVSKNTICPGGTIQLTNTSNFGLTIPTTVGASCISTAPYYWVIIPNSSPGNNWTVTSGNLGSNNGFINNQALWTNGSSSPTIQFNNPGVYTIELRVKNKCGISTYSKTICVIQPPVCSIVNNNSIGCSPLTIYVSSNSTLPLCGTTAIPVSYSWSVTNPTSCSGCSNSVASPSASSTSIILINNSNSIQTYTISLSITPLDPITNQPLSNPSCSSSCSITIQVYPKVQITPLTSCNGSLNWNLSNQVNVPSNFTWQATNNNNVSGETTLLQSSSAINDLLVNSSTTSQTVSYTINALSVSGSCPASATFTADLAVPLVVQPLINQTICVGGGISSPDLTLNYTGGTGTPTYSWQLNSNIITGATSNIYNPPSFSANGSYVYTGNVSLGPTGCIQTASQQATVTVVADPTISLQPVSASYCQDASPVSALNVSATGGTGTFSYQWYRNTTNSNIGGTLISGATSSSYTPPVSVVGIVYYYCVVSQSGLNCSVTSATAYIDINIPPSISQQPISIQNLCIGGTPNLLLVSYINGNGSANYQWYENTSNSTVGGSPIIGATSNSFLPSSSQAGTSYYYCVITFQYGGCLNIISSSSQVNVIIDPIITNQPTVSQMICQGTTLFSPLSFSYSGGIGNSLISWYQVGSPDILLNGITTSSFQPNNYNSSGTYNYYAIISFDGNGCDNSRTLVGKVIVNPTPYINNLSDTLICNKSRLDIDINSNVPSNIQWNAESNSNISGELFTTQTSHIINDSLTNSTSIPQYVTYHVIPTSFPYGCPGPDSTIVVQIQPDITLSMQTNIEICSGSPVNGILISNVPSDFSWFVSVDNINVFGESIQPSSSNLITDVLINNSNLNQVVVYSIQPISIFGACKGNSQTMVVTVKPPLSLLNEDTITICSGENLNINLVANTNVTFNWYADQSSNVINETTTVITSPLINDQLINNTNNVQQVDYHVIGTSKNNGCSSPIIPLIVYVNPIPKVYAIDDSVLCNSINFNPISFQGPVIGTLYNWTNSNPSIGIQTQDGINSTPGFLSVNNGVMKESSIFSIIPSFTNNNKTCTGNIENFKLTVMPTPTIFSVPDINVCNNVQVAQTILTGSISNTIFEWNNSNTSISLNSSGIGDIPSFIASNNTDFIQNSVVSVKPFLNSGKTQCFGQIEQFTINVNPSPHVQNQDIEICSGENTNINIITNVNSSIQWFAIPNTNVFNETSFPIQKSSYINDVLLNNSNVSQIVNYKITPKSLFGCIGPDSIINVKVNPLPVLDFSILNTPLCEIQPLIFQNNSIGNYDYKWYFGDNDSSYLVNPIHTYLNYGQYNINIEAIDLISGCQNFKDSLIIISKTPSALFNYSDSISCEMLEVVFTSDTINSNWSYIWDFGNGDYSYQNGVSAYQFTNSGCYDISLSVTNNYGCQSSQTINDAICILKKPDASFTVDNQILSTLEPIAVFHNTSTNSQNFIWDFGDNTTSIVENPIHIYLGNPANYDVILVASNNIGCVDTARINILLFQDLKLYVPNTFTPNDDEYNQVFLPILSEGFKDSSYKLMIFNRWGELIFESYDYKIGWDGTYGGVMAQDDTYTWEISVELLQNAEIKMFHGHVNLLK